MLTLSDCRNDRGLIAVANVDPTSQSFTDKINEACRRLLDRGDWWSTVVKTRFAVYDRNITWPRWVGTILAVNDFRNPVPARSSWYDFMPMDHNDYLAISRNYTSRHLGGDILINDVGTSPCFNNIGSGATNFILFYPRSANDTGKTVTIWGTDSNGWPATETLVMPNPSVIAYTSSVKQYITISRVEKDVTEDYLDGYQCATAVPGTLLDFGHYEPGETRGEYRMSVLRSAAPGIINPTTGAVYHWVSALIKLQHIPAVSANDFVSISNRAAIKLMVLAMTKEEASDPQGAETEIMRAVHELNLELNNKLPEFQTPISYEELGGVNMAGHGVF